MTLHILWKAISSHLFLWPIGSEWHWTFMKGSLITSVPMTNRGWVTLDILWNVVSSHLLLWQTVCEWHYTFCESSLITSFPMTNRKWVTLHILWNQGVITSFPMTNSEWVTLCILWKAVLLHLVLWPTGSEWHCTFCERQYHHICSYDQQGVSDIAHFVKGSLSHHIFSYDKQLVSVVTLHILWKAISLHLFLWPTGSE